MKTTKNISFNIYKRSKNCYELNIRRGNNRIREKFKTLDLAMDYRDRTFKWNGWAFPEGYDPVSKTFKKESSNNTENNNNYKILKIAEELEDKVRKLKRLLKGPKKPKTLTFPYFGGWKIKAGNHPFIKDYNFSLRQIDNNGVIKKWFKDKEEAESFCKKHNIKL